MYVCKLLQTNINSESLFKILLCKLCKRLHLANYDNYFTVTNSKYWVCWSSVASLLLKTWKLYTFFNFASIAATENRLLSYKKPQSFHRHVTVVFRPTHWKCITGVKNLGKIGEGVVGFWPQTNSILLFVFQTMVQSFIQIERELRP